eukprot:TRINITY_DN29507_c0_g1_i1.p1 TRINITY_DN29507_c0_g1~~TRINITY_DN29507_c0_g1_i1.p1  ORF type:complete len:958 (-),score=126.16 TRINITY_DN29507_c0_g1_i1:52-2877(-)
MTASQRVHRRASACSAVLALASFARSLAASFSQTPILPPHLFCDRSSVRIPFDASGVSALLTCEIDGAQTAGAASCCALEDVMFIFQHLEGSMSFVVRHLDDRQAFVDKYGSVSLGSHACAPALGTLLSPRLQILAQLTSVSEQGLFLINASVHHFLCAACSASAASKSRDDAQFAVMWSQVSQAVMGMYSELRTIDADVSEQLIASGEESCNFELVSALRRGVQAPSRHVVPIRPWMVTSGASAVDGFRESWTRWIDGLVGILSELAEQLIAEMSSLVIAAGHADRCRHVTLAEEAAIANNAASAACALLVKPPRPLALSAEMSSSSGSSHFASAGKEENDGSGGGGVVVESHERCIGESGSPPRLTLLVRMPNARTNLRFDFSSDPLTLDFMALDAHVSALGELVSPGAEACVVIVTSNPDQASILSRAAVGRQNVLVVWRRYALYNSDELALYYASQASDDEAKAEASRAVAVFEVPPGGDAHGLASAVHFLCFGGEGNKGACGGSDWRPPSPKSWPQPLRPALAQPLPLGTTLGERDLVGWPERVATTQRPLILSASHGAEGRSGRADDCPMAASVLDEYLEFHRGVVARLRQGAVKASDFGADRVLIYQCSALGMCGGHGDRLNAILGVFLLAVASRRAFFIDSPRPVPLDLMFGPRHRPTACTGAGEFWLDWRMHGAVSAVGRRMNYNDRHNDWVDDISWLIVDESEPVVVLHSNQRITMPLLQSAEARAKLGPSTVSLLLTAPYLHAELTDLLFEPSPLLSLRHAHVHAAARNGRRYLLAIHFRAGNRSPGRWKDPPRHRIEDLNAFLDCAVSAEERLGWPSNDVAWYLAADTAEVEDSPRVAELRLAGKLSSASDARLASGEAAPGVVHLDRSPLEYLVAGTADTWAQWLAIAAADAVVLSASGFGVTAAEAGRLRRAFLGSHGCVPVDLTAA